MFTPVNSRVALVILLLLAYGTLMGHNVVPHVHDEESTEHHHDHEHDHQTPDESPLSQLLSDVVHLPGSSDSFVNHLTACEYKFAPSFDSELVSVIPVSPPFIPPIRYLHTFREERIISFSVDNTPLRAPPVA